MRYTKRGVRHPVGVMLVLLVLMNMVVPPAYPVSRAARPTLPAQKQVEEKNHTPEQRGRIAFASDRDGDFEIYVMDPDGGGETRLTDDETEDTSPAWSPDGQRLAFVSFRDGNSEIYVMNDDGGSLTRLTNNPADDLDPAWSPDGTRIAFTSGRGNTDDVYVMNADGSNVSNLTNNTVGDDLQPAWSPNGAMLAFTSQRDADNEIYVMNADGSNQRNLTNNPADDANPTWSPMRITFQSNRDGNGEIYSINAADGSNPTRLTNSADNPDTATNEGFDVDPARSSDGARIVFASTRDGDFEIYSSGADGSNPTKLTDNEEANDIEPAVQSSQVTGQGTVQFSAASFTVGEGAGSVAITVTRTGDTTSPVEVDITASSGTASERSDFSAVLTTIRFASGETSRTVNVLITDDSFLEENETINLSLGSPVGATLGSPSSVTLTITDNDTQTATTNPIDDRDFFVRQQYRDFLNRDPDAPGLTFWAGEYDRRVNACNAVPTAQRTGCVASARASISLAFFLSVEYQQTGYLVYRAYDVAFARVGTPRPARGQPVSRVALTLDEYLSDTQTIARGIVVSNAVDRSVLEANTLEFFRRFVQREEFTARFPVEQSASQFVDALFMSANITPTAAERQVALTAYGSGGTEGRASSLRTVAENDQVFQREFNRAFVLQQYFGYLRRDPDIAGYNFWLNKLDAASTAGARIDPANVPNDAEAIGRVRRSEMIEAFIRSCEYQRRFGTPTTSPNDLPVATACGN